MVCHCTETGYILRLPAKARLCRGNAWKTAASLQIHTSSYWAHERQISTSFSTSSYLKPKWNISIVVDHSGLFCSVLVMFPDPFFFFFFTKTWKQNDTARLLSAELVFFLSMTRTALSNLSVVAFDCRLHWEELTKNSNTPAQLSRHLTVTLLIPLVTHFIIWTIIFMK